jgi:tetratricopeptide (TPR) repeat protein
MIYRFKVQNKSLSSSQKQHLGNTSYRHGQYAEAIQYYNSAIKQNPSPVLFGNRAACYFKIKQYRSALEDYEKAEKLNPTNGKR